LRKIDYVRHLSGFFESLDDAHRFRGNCFLRLIG
jgi:hypothetical protein